MGKEKGKKRKESRCGTNKCKTVKQTGKGCSRMRRKEREREREVKGKHTEKEKVRYIEKKRARDKIIIKKGKEYGKR